MKNKLYFFALALFLHLSFSAHAQIITTVAGDSLEGYGGDGGPATVASLNEPTGVAIDAAGNIYIVDRGNNRIRKVSAATGIITTIAGTGTADFSGDGGPATAAEINYPYDVAVDTLGNIYFSDDRNYRIRKIDTSGIITTIAGNGTFGYNDSIMATAAEFEGPSGITIDRYENIYVAVYNDNMVRKISPLGIITTVAGTGADGHSGDNGMATAATLNNPNDVKVDAIGNLYIADYSNNRVRKVDTSGIITTIAGNGVYGYNGDDINADSAEFRGPVCVAADGSGNVYISDSYNQRIREVNAAGIITTFAGDGTGGYSGDNGLAISAELADPVGLAIDNSGTLYIVDADNERVRRVGWPLSVNKLSASVQNLTVYPNPSTGSFTINISSSTTEQMKVTITNALSEKVKEISTFSNLPTAIMLDQSSGIYYLSAVGANGIMSKIINVIK